MEKKCKNNNGENNLDLWKKVDCVLFRNFHDNWKDPNINKYLGTNASEKFEGYLIIYKNKNPLFISHPFNYKQAKKELKNTKVVTFNERKDFEKIIKKETGKRIGINETFISYASVKALKKILKGKKLIYAGKEIEEAKEQKNKDEIKLIKKAVTETKKAIELVKTNLRKGVTEKQLKEKVKELFSKNGCETAFCIIAFGNNTSHIHHDSKNTKLEENMPILIDVGAKYEGYCADLSDTFWFGEKSGKRFAEFEKERKKVEAAQKEIEKVLKEGTLAKELYITATKYIGKLPHAIGHGIGLEVHDAPAGIGEKSKWKLKEGMILAIEPAIYKKTFGIRLEKDYKITKKGFEEL